MYLFAALHAINRRINKSTSEYPNRLEQPLVFECFADIDKNFLKSHICSFYSIKYFTLSSPVFSNSANEPVSIYSHLSSADMSDRQVMVEMVL